MNRYTIYLKDTDSIFADGKYYNECDGDFLDWSVIEHEYNPI
jgi:hypothetical protein